MPLLLDLLLLYSDQRVFELFPSDLINFGWLFDRKVNCVSSHSGVFAEDLPHSHLLVRLLEVCFDKAITLLAFSRIDFPQSLDLLYLLPLLHTH